jgi:hypothetical protein
MGGRCARRARRAHRRRSPLASGHDALDRLKRVLPVIVLPIERGEQGPDLGELPGTAGQVADDLQQLPGGPGERTGR